MDASQYSLAMRIREDLIRHGFTLRVRDSFIFVGLDTQHSSWRGWGLVHDNAISAGLSSMEEVQAWVDGFLAFQQYYTLSAKSRESAHASARILQGVDP